MIQKDVQKRVLRAMRENGNTANSREISYSARLSMRSVNVATKYLVSRALIYRERPQKTFPPLPDTFHLRMQLIEKIDRLISEIGVENDAP